MTDMAQADRTLRTQNKPTPYTWAEVKFLDGEYQPPLGRGDICVIRGFNGSPEVLRLDDQHHYKEWVGCFSYLGERR